MISSEVRVDNRTGDIIINYKSQLQFEGNKCLCGVDQVEVKVRTRKLEDNNNTGIQLIV